MSITTPSSVSAVDWAQLYKDIETRGNIPYAASRSIDASHATFQAMYLDLADIKNAISNSSFDPPLVTIYADVLNIPAGLSWSLKDAVLFIAARRIQTDGSATVNLDYRAGQTSSLVLFTNQVQGTINAIAVTEQDGPHPTIFAISSAPASGGLQVHLQDGAPVLTPRNWAQGMATYPTQVFQQALITEFIFASLLYDLHPDIALDQFTWLKDWSAESPDLLSIFFRSSSLLALLSSQINAQKNGAAFVPYLTQQVYTDLASAFVAEARQYESDYRGLSTQQVVTDNFIKQAKTLLDNQTYQSQYTAKLLDQAKSNYNNAVAAAEAAQKTFNDAQLKAELVQIDFKDRGIPEWEREKIAEAIIKLGMAVITFGVGIAAMLVGDEAGGAASAGAAIEGAKAVEEAAKAGTEIAKMAKELGDVMKKLKKIIEALQKVYEFSKQVVEAAGDIRNAQSYADKMKKMDVATDGADLSASYEWQIYQLNADAAIEGPINQGVGYAKDLKLAIDAVAIYGQALAAAQLASIKAGQEYATVRLQKELSEQQQRRLQDYVDSLKTGEQPIVAMMQQFYQRYIDAKSSLFAAIAGYRASYFYWALEHSAIQPMIIDSVDDLDTGLKTLTAIALDRATALEHFSPPPQSLIGKRVVIDDPTVLGNLREKKTASWTVNLDTETFDGFDRVRLTQVRTWLEGAKPALSSQRVNVMISTAGNYLDRFEGTNYQFTSKPLQRDFEYRVSPKKEGIPAWEFDDGTYGYIEVDGVVDREVSYAYFEPTPFGEWRINLTAHNPGLDLSGVTKITIDFAGSVIPETQAAALRAREVMVSAGGRSGGSHRPPEEA